MQYLGGWGPGSGPGPGPGPRTRTRTRTRTKDQDQDQDQDQDRTRIKKDWNYLLDGEGTPRHLILAKSELHLCSRSVLRQWSADRAHTFGEVLEVA